MLLRLSNLYGFPYAILCEIILAAIARRIKMRVASLSSRKSVLEQKYAAKGDLHYGLRLSYNRMAQAVREGKLALHLIDGKIQLEVDTHGIQFRD